MWRLIAAVVAALILAGCASTAGADRDPHGSAPTTPSPGTAAQAMAAALAFAAHSDPKVGVVDGYAVLPLAVQRGQQPIDLAGGQADPCARPPTQRFTSSERAPSTPPFRAAPCPLSKTPPPRLASVRLGRCCWSPPSRCWPAGAAPSWCSAACPIPSRSWSRSSGTGTPGRPRRPEPASAELAHPSGSTAVLGAGTSPARGISPYSRGFSCC